MTKLQLSRLMWLLFVTCSTIVFYLSLQSVPASRSAPLTGTTWFVTTSSDNVNDGSLATHSGSLRFALAHAASGDFVSFAQYGGGTITAGSTLTVPVGVAVGHTRDEACGNVESPLANIKGANTTINPVLSLSADTTLRNVDVGSGYNGVKVTGGNVDVCAVGLGVQSGGDSSSLPPLRAALIVDGDHAVIHRNLFNSYMVVGIHGSDSRIGDTLYGSGEGNEGLCGNRGLCGVTVYADASGAAQRVIIRDSFARGLTGLPGSGVSGGDDDPKHSNNWAQTPTILTAQTFNNFATVQVFGVANPNSLVDIYFDNNISLTRQLPVTATVAGTFSFSGTLPGTTVRVIAVSTLNDPAHLNRAGSSSQFSDPVQVTVGVATTELQLNPTALTFSALVGGVNPPAQYLLVTAPSVTPTLAWQTSVTTTDGLNWLNALPFTSSGDGTISVTVNATSLLTGTYHGTVTVFDPAQPIDQATANVTLNVVAPPPPPVPTLHLAPSVLTFTAALSESSPAPQQLAIWVDPISPTLTWAIDVTTTNSLNWLSVAPLTSSGDDVVTVTVNATSLLTGTYHGAVRVYELAHPTDQVTADVDLIVEPAPPVLDKRVWLPMIMR